MYIDESAGLRKWLNGQIINIDESMENFLTKLQSLIELYPSLSCTEEEWQAYKTASPTGQVGKFVLNYDDGTETWSIFNDDDSYRVFKKPADEVVAGDVAYDWDYENQQIIDEDTTYEVTATWYGSYTGTKIVSFDAGGINGWRYDSDYEYTPVEYEAGSYQVWTSGSWDNYLLIPAYEAIVVGNTYWYAVGREDNIADGQVTIESYTYDMLSGHRIKFVDDSTTREFSYAGLSTYYIPVTNSTITSVRLPVGLPCVTVSSSESEESETSQEQLQYPFYIQIATE